MSEIPTHRLIEKTVAVALLLLVLFASPFLNWWSQSGLPWYAPYLFWLGIILLTAMAQKYKSKDDL